MLHSYIGVYVHCVWTTRNRERTIPPDVRNRLAEHIMTYGIQNSIAIDALNVLVDHVHVLISLKSNQQLDSVLQLLKGESSHWMNFNNMIQGKFRWQRGFAAFSVGRAHLARVREYIRMQEQHHRRKSIMEEINEMLAAYGIHPTMGHADSELPGPGNR